MFPVVLDVTELKIMVVGNGPATLRRLVSLKKAGAGKLKVFSDTPTPELKEEAGALLVERLPAEKDFEKVQVVFIGDLNDSQTAWLTTMAHSKNVLVNAEDKRKWC